MLRIRVGRFQRPGQKQNGVSWTFLSSSSGKQVVLIHQAISASEGPRGVHAPVGGMVGGEPPKVFLIHPSAAAPRPCTSAMLRRERSGTVPARGAGNVHSNILLVFLGSRCFDAGTVGGPAVFLPRRRWQHPAPQVISPVMATSWRTFRLSGRRPGVAMVTPAEGPSLGTAPSGTWSDIQVLVKFAVQVKFRGVARTQERAAMALSFITSPTGR